MSKRRGRSVASQPEAVGRKGAARVGAGATPEPSGRSTDAVERTAEIARVLRAAGLAPADEPSFVFRVARPRSAS